MKKALNKINPKFKNKKEIIFKLRKDINKLESYLSTLDNTDDLSVIVYRL